MFRKFFDRFRPKRHADAIFGELLLMATRDPDKSYWEGRGTFPATGHSIEYFIDGPKDGSSTGQHAFYPASQ